MSRKNKFIVATVLLMSWVLGSCANLGDASKDLGDGYSYQIDGSTRWIGTDHVIKEKIYPNVLDYNYDDKFIIVTQAPSIKEYKRFLAQDLRDKYSYIIESKDNRVKRNIDEMKFLKSHLWVDMHIHERVIREIKPNNQASYEKIGLIADSLMKFDPYLQRDFSQKINYWIIIKKDNLIVGPLSQKEYIKKRKELGVPKNLRMVTSNSND